MEAREYQLYCRIKGDQLNWKDLRKRGRPEGRPKGNSRVEGGYKTRIMSYWGRALQP